MRAFKQLLSVLLCLVLFAGCGGKSGPAEQLARDLEDRGFRVSVTRDVSPAEMGPALGDSRIDLLKLDGEPRMAVYVFSTAEERDQGVADWEGYAALALFAEDGLPHLFTEDTCLLIYYGVDENLLAALSELWQPV